MHVCAAVQSSNWIDSVLSVALGFSKQLDPFQTCTIIYQSMILVWLALVLPLPAMVSLFYTYLVISVTNYKYVKF